MESETAREKPDGSGKVGNRERQRGETENAEEREGEEGEQENNRRGGQETLTQRCIVLVPAHVIVAIVHIEIVV